MKEFDFDELDKAVNSLMGTIDKDKPAEQTSAPAPDQPVAPSSPLTPSSSSPSSIEPTSPSPSLAASQADRAPTAPQPEPVVEKPSPATDSPSSVSGVTQPRSGRFMDVVHPSSDMTTPAPVVVPPRREAPAVQPISRPASVEGVAKPVVDVMAPSPATVPEMKKDEDEPDNKTGESTEPTDDLPTVPSVEQWSSPFLPDAQVEKRPLGGAPPAGVDLSQDIANELAKPLDEEKGAEPQSPESEEKEAVSAPETPESSLEDETATETKPDDNQLAPTNTETAPLPAELNSDLVAIESGQKSTPSSDEKALSPRDASASSINSLESRAANTTASIPQQYTEQPSSGDESHTPIYDNEGAHHPLAHPAKKKSGWLVVLLVVAILLVGAGLGAGAYFIGLI